MTSTAVKLLLNVLSGGGAAAPFSPLDIPGLALWLDASDSTTLFQDSAGTTPATADNDVVGRWADKSGNGRHATQTTTANKPLLKLAQLNGRNVIRFDGGDDRLASTFGSTLAQPMTLLMVVKKTTTSSTVIYDGIDGTNRQTLETGGSAAIAWAGGATINVANILTSWSIINVVYNGASSSMAVYGGLSSSGSIGTNGTAGLTIGSRHNGMAPSDMDVAELIQCNAVLSASQLLSANQYYSGKWGVA